jgi:hypothetical protein
MVRPDIGGHQSVSAVEQEFASLSDVHGWKLHSVFHLGMEKSGSHNVMFILVRETERVMVSTEVAAKRGRPAKVE